MANGILDFFSREAGQQRRKALDEAIEYYTPPNLRGLLGFAAEMTPTRGIERAGLASQKLFDPGTSGWDRASALGDMASEIAGVVAPAAVAGKVGMPAAQALQEGLMGFSTSPQGVALRNFAGDESGALRLFQGSPHDFNAERLVRMPDGSTQYIVGRPDVLPDIPPGAEVLRDFPLGRMRLDKIGTGEGAQAYGHGLYVAENEGVARWYRDALSDRDAPLGAFVKPSGDTVDVLDAPDGFYSLLGEAPDNTSYDQLLKAAQDKLEWAQTRKGGLRDELTRKAQKVLNFVKENDGVRFERNPARGRMYEVNVNANPEDFLDWDKPFASADDVERFAARFDAVDPALRKRIEDFGYMRQQMGQPMPDGNDIIREVMGGIGSKDAARASEAMREAGIPGIRYLDQTSRGVGEGSRNYVLFDENLIDIVKKYGIAGAAAMLGVNAIDVEQAMAQGRPQPRGLLGYGVQ